MAPAKKPAAPSLVKPDFADFDPYRADFSAAETKGAGFEFTHGPSKRSVDFRFLGGKKAAAKRIGGKQVFYPKEDVVLDYERTETGVKETITLLSPVQSEFAFKVIAPKMQIKPQGKGFHIGDDIHPALFKVSPPVAWDANGAAIEVSNELVKNGTANRLVLKVDQGALQTATFPVFIDPTVEGTDTSATSPTHSRKIFRTDSGDTVFFYREPFALGMRLVYRVSHDDGGTWDAPITISNLNAGGAPSVVHTKDNHFLVAYTDWTSSGGAWVAFRDLSPSGAGTWSVGGEVRVASGGIQAWPYPTVVDLGPGPLGRRIAVGFNRSDAVLGMSAYSSSFSENSGNTWTLPIDCTWGWAGTLVTQGSRVFCLTSDPMEWREWQGAAWGQPNPLPISARGVGDFPSWVEGEDGTVHLVVAGSSGAAVEYTSLAPGATSWTPAQSLGAGLSPVVSGVGDSLYVYAHSILGPRESVISARVSHDKGATWALDRTLGGKPFQEVFDFNQKWAFVDQPGDLLFNFRSASSILGNGIAAESYGHRLDASSKTLSFSFVAPNSGDVTSIKLWTRAQDAPAYRIGLQSDVSNAPSGQWLQPTDPLDLAAFTDVKPKGPTSGAASPMVATVPKTGLVGDTRYHVVIEPVPGADELTVNSPSPSRWVEVEAVGADMDLGAGLSVLDGQRSGSTVTGHHTDWAISTGQVPRFALNSSTGTVVEQQLGVSVPLRLNEFSVPSQTFVTPIGLTPTEVRLNFTKVGNPTSSPSLRVLDQAGAEIFSTPIAPKVGWVALPISGLTIAAGTKYRMVLDDPNRDRSNFWMIRLSGDASSSWLGTEAVASRADDRPGFNNRKFEAMDGSVNSRDLSAFNSGPEDALYLGNSHPFDFVQLTAASYQSGPGPQGNLSKIAWSFFDGASWSPLPTSPMPALASGNFTFAPPSTWSPTSVEGVKAFWLKGDYDNSVTESLIVDRVTSIHNLAFPTVPPIANKSIALGYRKIDTPAGISVEAYTDAPTLRVSTDMYGGQNTGPARNPSVSDDGRFVAWEHASDYPIRVAVGPVQYTAKGTCAGVCTEGRIEDTNRFTDIYVRDRLTGRVKNVTAGANGSSWNPQISGDGKGVVFESHANNLDPCYLGSGDCNSVPDIYVSSTDISTSNAPSALKISPNGGFAPSISKTSKFISYISDAKWNYPSRPGQNELMIRHFSCVSIDSCKVIHKALRIGDEPLQPSGRPTILENTGDKATIYFPSPKTNIVSNDTNSATDIFEAGYNWDPFLSPFTRVSVADDEQQANGNSDGPVSVSATGKIVFKSYATNLLSQPDTNGTVADVFVRDGSTTQLVSVNTLGQQGGFESYQPDISADGDKVVFTTRSSNLVSGDVNGVTDVMVRDMSDGSIKRASVDSSGIEGEASSQLPSISADGTSVFFESSSASLVREDTNRAPDIFSRDIARSCGTGDVGAKALVCILAPTWAATSDDVGLENFFPYEDWDTGDGKAFVNMATGNLVLQHDDITVPGTGLNFQLSRTYNSFRDEQEGPLGRGWSLGVAEGEGYSDLLASVLSTVGSIDLLKGAVLVQESDQFSFFDSDGTRHKFVKGGPFVAKDSWESPPGVDLRLTESGTGESRVFTLTRPDGIEYRLIKSNISGETPKYVLERISDRKGNRLDLTYNPSSGKIEQVADIHGRKLIFSWNGQYLSYVRFVSGVNQVETQYVVDTVSKRLTSVTEFVSSTNQTSPSSQRTITFEYQTQACPIVCVRDARNAETKVLGAGGRVSAIVDRASKQWDVSYGEGEQCLSSGSNPTACVTSPEDSADPARHTLQWFTDSDGTPFHRLDEGETEANGEKRRNSKAFRWGERRLISSVDEDGNTTQYAWRDNGQLDATIFTGRNEPSLITDLVYRDVDVSAKGIAFLKSSTSALGSADGERTWQYETDDQGKLKWTVDPVAHASGSGKKTLFQYHPNGLLSSITDSNGGVTAYGNASATNYGYDPSGQPLSIIDASGKQINLSYDFLGRTTQKLDRLSNTWTYNYDLRGNLTKSVVPTGAGTVSTSAACFDLQDNAILVIEPGAGSISCAQTEDAAFVTRKAYDLQGQLIDSRVKSFDPAGLNPQLRRTSYSYYADGQLKSIDEPRSFDAAGNPTATSQRVSYEYFPNNRLKTFRDEEANETSTYYTSGGRPAVVLDPPGYGGIRRATNYTYTGKGQVASILESGHSQPTVHTYNAFGERISTKNPGGNATTFNYDKMGRMTLSVDALARATSRTYDTVGNLKSLTQPTGAAGSTTVNYWYTKRNEIDCESDPGDPLHLVKYSYDAEGRQLGRYDLANRSSCPATVDEAASVAKRTVLQQWRPDGLLKERASTGASGEPSTGALFDYDLSGNRKSTTSRLAEVVVSSISTGYASTGEIRTLTETLLSSSGINYPKSSSFNYTPDGLLASRKVDDKETVYQYKLNGLETQATAWDGSGNFKQSYFGDGQLNTATLPNGVSVVQTYDLADRMRERLVRKSDNTILTSWLGRSYDENDNLLNEAFVQLKPNQTLPSPSSNSAFAYDKLDRMTSSKHAVDQKTSSYTLDDAGNIRNDGDFTYDYTLNRLKKRLGVAQQSTEDGLTFTSQEAFDYRYNALGNQDQEVRVATMTVTDAGGTSQVQTETTTTNHTYDGASHPLRTSRSDGSWVEFTYDGLERMIRRVEGLNASSVTTTLFFHDGLDEEIVLETNVSGGVETRYLLDSTNNPLAKQDFNGWGYLIEDARGSVVQVVDAGQVVKAVFAYDPFGKEKTGYTSKVGSWDSRLRFQKGPQDPKTGAYNLGPRIYDPKINRFVGADFYVGSAANMELQLDPLTGNRYLYAGANPANMIDDGHAPKKPGFDCAKSLAKIRGLRNELSKRAKELQQDKLMLPWVGKMSVGGHQNKFRETQGRLRKELAKWDSNNCGSKGGGALPSDCRSLASMPAPTPRGRSLASALAAPAGLAGAGLAIWWAGKLLSPLCGPGVLVCAVAL